jgi:dTDP-glucose 4,6-dehydratase
MTRLPEADLEHVLAHGGKAFESLRGARVLVTGGTGFIGTWLVGSFARANARLRLGAEMVVLSLDAEAFARNTWHLASDPSIRFHGGDVRTFETPPGRFSHVIHAATPTTGTLNAERPLEMLDVIAQGTRHTLDVAESTGAKRVLVLSSGAVYGRQPPTLTHAPESYTGAPDPLDPTQAYAEGKRVGELLGGIYARDRQLQVVVARCFAFAGPYLPLDAHFAIGNFMRDAMRGGKIVIGGDGTPFRSYMHAADLAVWLWTLLVRGEAGRAYNVGSERAVTIRELAEMVARIAAATLGRPVTVTQRHASDPTRPAERYVPSTRRAREELELDAWIPLEDAIARTLAWHHRPTTTQSPSAPFHTLSQ